jgi:hypothetical protein
MQHHDSSRLRTRPPRTSGPLALTLVAALAPLVLALPAQAQPKRNDFSIILPEATGTEGIAAGPGTTFYAGDLGTGDIFRGDVDTRTAELFIDAPTGRKALGMKYDARNGLLFVAGGDTGQAFVYDTKTGDSISTYDLAPGFINDVTLTDAGAWFTNSQSGELYRIPISCDGELGKVETLTLSGPAAETPGSINLNGIASVRGGRVLLVGHLANGTIYTVDPDTGASAATGLDLPNVDGLLAVGRRVWAVQNRSNQISKLRLDRDLGGAQITKVITSPLFQVPTTVARFGSTLAAANAKFGRTDVDSYDVVVVGARQEQ